MRRLLVWKCIWDVVTKVWCIAVSECMPGNKEAAPVQRERMLRD